MIGLSFSLVPLTCELLHNILTDNSCVQFYNPVYKPVHLVYAKDFLSFLWTSCVRAIYWLYRIQKAPQQLELLEVTTLQIKNMISSQIQG